MLSQHKTNDEILAPQVRKTLVATAMGLCLSTASGNGLAALENGVNLTINLGEGSCAAGGTFPNCNYGANIVTSGSYFSMDGDFGSIVEGDLGIVLGTTQPFSGTVPSQGNSYIGDGTNITKAWPFFNNLGTNFTTSAVNIINDSTLDLSGWRVAWGEVPEINMGGGGTASMSCGSCLNGDPYILDYSAVVPPGDPSGFGGVLYAVHLEGNLIFPGTPPSTQPDSAKTIIGNAVQIDVLANDSSADGLDPSSVAIVRLASNGGTAVNPDGSVTYTPDTGPDFQGMDDFDYTVDSLLGITSAATLVDVHVEVNVAPVANDDELTISTAALDNGGGSAVIDVLSNDTDANNDPGLPGGIDTTTVEVLSQPALGSCSANPDGTITYSQIPPSAPETGTCTYQVKDIDTFGTPLTSNTSTVDINVTSIASDWPAALPADIIPFLDIEPGIPGNPNDTSVPPKGGSYFTMQVSSQTLIYTMMIPGPAGGVVVDHEQPVGISHTGAPNGNEQTAIELGWNFFGNTGFTMSKNGGIIGNPDGTLQFAGAGGIGNSQGRWLISWNGIPEIDLGGSASFSSDLGFATITCNPAPCADQSAFTLDYAAHVPPGDPSGFGRVPYTLQLVGTVRFLDDQPKTLNGDFTLFDRMTADDTGVIDADVVQQCVGDCFDYTIDNVTDPSVSIVLPLAGGVPLNPVWRILNGGTWQDFDTTNGDTIKSAPLDANATECPGPGDPAYVVDADGKPVIGHQCIELTIADNGPNDKNPAIGTITDPSGMGGGGTAGGGGGDSGGHRGTNTSGCSLTNSHGDAGPSHNGEWWLLAGTIAWLGWRRRKRKTG